MIACRGSFHSTKWRMKSFDFKPSKNLQMGSFPGLFRATFGIGGCGDAIRQPTIYSQYSTLISAETRFSLHQGLTSHSNDPSHLPHLGVCILRRCMSTVGRVGGNVDQAKSTVPGDASISDRIKVKRLDKTAKHIMNILDKEALDKVKSERNIPEIEPGYIVEIKVEAPENKGRTSTVKGIVIAKRNSNVATAIRVRRLESGVGTESVFPLYSPNIKDIKVLEKRSVRRAKLYYIRDRPYNVALRELAQRTAKKKEMVLRAERAEKSQK